MILLLLEIMRFDKEIGIVYQLMFSSDFQLKYKFNDFTVEDGTEIYDLIM